MCVLRVFGGSSGEGIFNSRTKTRLVTINYERCRATSRYRTRRLGVTIKAAGCQWSHCSLVYCRPTPSIPF